MGIMTLIRGYLEDTYEFVVYDFCKKGVLWAIQLLL